MSMLLLEVLQSHVMIFELSIDRAESWEGMEEQKRVMRSSHQAEQAAPLLVAGKRSPFVLFPSLAKPLEGEMAM